MSTDRDHLTPAEMRAVRVLFHQMVVESNEDDLGVILRSGCWHHLDDDDGAVCRLAEKLRASPEELDTTAILRTKIRKGRT